MDVFLGGEGEGKRSSRVCVVEKFSQDFRAPNSPVCVVTVTFTVCVFSLVEGEF